PACGPTCGPPPDEADAFARAMRLLARHDRKQRSAERKFKPGGRRQEWTFERSIEALDKALRGVGRADCGGGRRRKDGKGAAHPTESSRRAVVDRRVNAGTHEHGWTEKSGATITRSAVMP